MIIDVPSFGFVNFDNVFSIRLSRYADGKGKVIAYRPDGGHTVLYSGNQEQCFKEIVNIHDAYLNGDSHVVVGKEDTDEEG